jgi:hypothetical protein
MVKNQLFRSEPTEELCLDILKAFGLTSLDDMTTFSKKDLEKMGTVDKLYEMKSRLEECYIPCKARTYLNDITPKNSITILRQFMRCVDRKVMSKEKYHRTSKYVIYQVTSLTTKMYQPVQIKSSFSSYMINFD